MLALEPNNGINCKFSHVPAISSAPFPKNYTVIDSGTYFLYFSLILSLEDFQCRMQKN